MSASLINLRRFSQRLRDRDDGGLDEAMISDTIDNIRYFPANEATIQMQNSLSRQLSRQRATEGRIVDESQATGNALRQTAADVVDSTASNTSGPRKRIVVEQEPSKKQPTAKSSNLFDDTSSAAKIHSLMLDQKDINAQELEKEQESKFKLMEELAGLTDVLKRSTVQINATVVEQNKQLTQIGEFASENMEDLTAQKKKMNERSKTMKKSVWTSVFTVLWILGLFAVTYAVIRLLPKPRPILSHPRSHSPPVQPIAPSTDFDFHVNRELGNLDKCEAVEEGIELEKDAAAELVDVN